MLVPLTPGDSGAHIRLVRIGTTRRGYVYQDTFVTTSGGFAMYMMSNYGLSLMLAEILLIFSGVLALHRHFGSFVQIHVCLLFI